MATKSFLKNINIKSRKDTVVFLNALESAVNKAEQYKDSKLNREVNFVKKEELKGLFDDTKL